MSNPRKAKGTKWETDIKGFANSVLGAMTKVYRPAQEGFKDTGDLHGVSPFIVQAKDWKNWQEAIRLGLDGAVQQAIHAGEKYGVVVVKRARKPIGDAYAVMRLLDWLSFYKEYLQLQEENLALRQKLDGQL